MSVLAVDGVGRDFGALTVLDGVSFSVDGPGLWGILGPNGAGKTTLLDILQGLAQPTRGSVRLFGAEIRRYPRRRVGVVLQREAVLERCTVREYAALFAAIYGTARDAIVDAAGLVARARTPMARLSGGELGRLVLAAAMAHQPELLFLDEPTAPLDPRAKRELGGLLREIARTRTVILTTHDLAEAEAICDHFVFLVDGRVRAAGAREAVLAGRSMEEAFFHFCGGRLHEGALDRG
jgi:ABC-2 type transport system ATP-binding protein